MALVHVNRNILIMNQRLDNLTRTLRVRSSVQDATLHSAPGLPDC
jgi:hypothetical protein